MSEAVEKADDVRSPTLVGTYEIALQLTTARTIKVNGYLFAGDTLEDINGRIDLMQEVLERQGIRADVQNKEARMEALVQGIEQHTERLQVLNEKKKKGVKLATQERLTVERADLDVRGAKNEIDSLAAAIRVGKSKLKMNGAAPLA